jgi:hypothetical protein
MADLATFVRAQWDTRTEPPIGVGIALTGISGELVAAAIGCQPDTSRPGQDTSSAAMTEYRHPHAERASSAIQILSPDEHQVEHRQGLKPATLPTHGQNPQVSGLYAGLEPHRVARASISARAEEASGAQASSEVEPPVGPAGVLDLAGGWRGDRHRRAEIAEREVPVRREPAFSRGGRH